MKGPLHRVYGRARSAWVKSRQTTGQKNRCKRRVSSLLWLEPLEEIVLLNGTVTRINAGGGDWGTASNWRDQNGVNRLPGATDDAVINVPGNVSITHAVNAVDTVASLTLGDAFSLSAGTLAVMGN